MALQLFFHPFSSYCQKALIALYENATPFEPQVLNGPDSPAAQRLATDMAAQKLARVLVTDPGMGVIRHADAGYQRAIDVAAERGVRIPMSEQP